MEAFEIYLFRSVIWLTGFALVYFLFLRDERFFFLIRYYLIAGILTSFLFPLITIHYKIFVPAVNSIQVDGAVFGKAQNLASVKVPDTGLIIMVLYVAGVIFVLARLIKQIRLIVRVIKKSEITEINSVKLIRTPEFTTSFSFFSYLFVNHSVKDIEAEEIVNHEKVHISQKHWIDLVFMELLCMLQWFNPFAWIYMRFIKQNHEYLADSVALNRTSDPAVYKATLLNQIMGIPVVSLTNSFNYSLNAKRFKMMKNIISSPYRKLRTFLILPVFAIVLYSFASPEYHYLPPVGNDMIIAKPPVIFIREVQGIVVNEDNKSLEGVTIVVSGTSLGAISDADGSFTIGNVPDEASLVFTFPGYITQILKPDFDSDMNVKMLKDQENAPSSVRVRLSGTTSSSPPLVVIDGVISDNGVDEISPDDIASISVLKDVSATHLYGEKGKDGVIEITTKKNDSGRTQKTMSDVQVTGYASDQKQEVDVFTIVEKMPEFPGGNESMTSWIVKNVKYPVAAIREKITGKVIVNFIVSSTGKVRNVKVIRSVHPLLDAEAVRVISSMPDWIPGSQTGKAVDVEYYLPVDFNLE